MCLNQAPMTMASPVRERAVTDIRATAALHNDIAGNLLVISGLSGALCIRQTLVFGRRQTRQADADGRRRRSYSRFRL